MTHPALNRRFTQHGHSPKVLRNRYNPVMTTTAQFTKRLRRALGTSLRGPLPLTTVRDVFNSAGTVSEVAKRYGISYAVCHGICTRRSYKNDTIGLTRGLGDKPRIKHGQGARPQLPVSAPPSDDAIPPVDGTLISRARVLFTAGTRVSLVATQLGISTTHASQLHIRYLKETNSPKVHHIGKADMIHTLLTGRRGLTIYETCASPPSGAKGVCTEAYEQHGLVTTRRQDDGDWMAMTYQALSTGVTFDVVDADGYTDPHELLTIGISRLVKPGGLLLTTWPSRGIMERFPVTKIRSIIIGGATPADRMTFLERAAITHGQGAELVSLNTYDSTVRMAHRVTSLKWGAAGKDSKPIQLAQALFGANP